MSSSPRSPLRPAVRLECCAAQQVYGHLRGISKRLPVEVGQLRVQGAAICTDEQGFAVAGAQVLGRHAGIGGFDEADFFKAMVKERKSWLLWRCMNAAMKEESFTPTEMLREAHRQSTSRAPPDSVSAQGRERPRHHSKNTVAIRFNH